MTSARSLTAAFGAPWTVSGLRLRGAFRLWLRLAATQNQSDGHKNKTDAADDCHDNRVVNTHNAPTVLRKQ